MIPFKVGETVWRKYTYDFSFYDSYVVVKINHLDLERFLINKTSKNECRNDYFVIAYESNDFNELKNLEFFLKAILNYPPDYDISQDQNFTNFRKDFSPNYKIQTYYKSPSFYHYIHYPGGKAKFEEDFGKYLYTNRQK